MTYARNVAFDLHWGLIAGETANSATSPLNVLLLAAVTLVVRDPHIAVGVVLVASILLLARWLATVARLLGLSRVTPYLGTGLLLLNPLLLSTVGLEPYLEAAVVAGLLRYGVQGRSVAFGVAGGLAFLTRPDLAVFVLVGAIVFPAVRRQVWRAAGVAALVVAPWHLWSWFVLGSALPDTLIMKAGQSTWASFGFWDGWLLYWGAVPVAAVLAFLTVLLGGSVLLAALACRLARRASPWQVPAAFAGLGAVAHYLTYCALGTPPYHWYYALLIIGMTLCLALGVGRLVAAGTAGWRRGAAVASVAGLVAVLAAMAGFDVRHGLPWERAPISTNWATAAQYERIGTELGALVGQAGVRSPGEIGTLAYYCHCAIVDQFSDRARVLDAIGNAEEHSGPILGALIELNYLHLDRDQRPLPVDYRLVYQRGQDPAGPRQWPVYQWADGPGRMVLLPAG